MAESSFGVVRNIPGEFHSSDLKNFFSDFVETGKFKCFHFKHRPEALKPPNREKPHKSDVSDSDKLRKTGTCCCVFQTVDEDSLHKFIGKYNNMNWIDSAGSYLKDHCIIHRIKVSTPNTTDINRKSISTFAAEVNYSTRGEQSYKKRHAATEDFSEIDLAGLSELRPPIHVMPRGNVGTTTKEFMQLIRDCKLPPRIIKKLDLRFPTSGSTRRYGNVAMNYTDTHEDVVPGTNIYTAKGDAIETNANPISGDLEDAKNADSPESQTQVPATGENVSDADADDDTCEEWERHEALHNDVTSQERTKERLFEEEIELKWEKGGSGLVFYTDAQYWQEQEGDFDEQTTDDWDVDMSEYYGERGDLDARQYLQMRKERRNGKAVYDDSLMGDLLPRKRRKQTRSRSESPPIVTQRGYFERHTKGVGRRLLEKGGWKEGDPLGPQERPGAITDPLQLDGQHPRVRRGLGYHGEKLLKPGKTSVKGSSRVGRLTPSLRFRGTRSREPLASHSYLFPQYSFHLPNNDSGIHTKASRKHAVPGLDDGIVITTAYDDPLDIDEQDDFMRSRHPAALKRNPRRKSGLSDEALPSQCQIQAPPSKSKLISIKPERNKRAEELAKGGPSSTTITPLHLSSVKFVKGGTLNSE